MFRKVNSTIKEMYLKKIEFREKENILNAESPDSIFALIEDKELRERLLYHQGEPISKKTLNEYISRLSPKDYSILLKQENALQNYRDNYSKWAEDYFLFSVSSIRSILLSIKESIPSDSELSEAKKRRADDTKELVDRLLRKLREIAENISDQFNHISLPHYLEENSMCVSEFEDYSDISKELSFDLFLLLYNLSNLSTHAMFVMHFQQAVEEYFYGKGDETDDTLAIVLSEIYCVKEGINTLNKKDDQIIEGLKETGRKIDVQGDKSSRENKNIENKITKRNQKESRNELTQMDCAIIIARVRNTFNKKKKDLLIALGKSTEKIKNVDPENIKRTIEGWDIAKPNPPAGYSRRISEYEFEEWAKKREARKFEKWRIRLQKSLKMDSIDSMREDELHARMEQDRGSEDDFRYFDENEKK